MLKELFKRLKKVWCSMKCCFESNCNLEARDTDGDGIPDEIVVSNTSHRRRSSV